MTVRSLSLKAALLAASSLLLPLSDAAAQAVEAEDELTIILTIPTVLTIDAGAPLAITASAAEFSAGCAVRTQAIAHSGNVDYTLLVRAEVAEGPEGTAKAAADVRWSAEAPGGCGDGAELTEADALVASFNAGENTSSMTYSVSMGLADTPGAYVYTLVYTVVEA